MRTLRREEVRLVLLILVEEEDEDDGSVIMVEADSLTAVSLGRFGISTWMPRRLFNNVTL